MWAIVREPLGVKSLFLRGRIENINVDLPEGMGVVCCGGGAIAGVFSRVEPTSRRDAGCCFGVLSRDCVGTTATIRRF